MEGTTIKELSQELNVSEQALRKWCKQNGIEKQRNNSNETTKPTKPTYILSFDDVIKAKKHYLSETNETIATEQGNQSNETKETNETKATKPTKAAEPLPNEEIQSGCGDLRATNESKLLDILQNELETLRKQLEVKDKQIEYLQEKLTAAQALHAGTLKALQEKQEQAQTTAAENEPEPTTKAAAAPAPAPERKPKPHKQQPERRGTLQKLLRRFTGRK